ncbi:hypothetical protein C2845_PM10G07530 [Panicum miliaceum]|uniref:Uncharacterized protein n=1 Tax=Panicum miliaceum TaxID=4540 RepID=A0A3L6PCN0_PANMI|nr:hypothetical protein C2845_PM10G07530 [Panicum miliaceum]
MDSSNATAGAVPVAAPLSRLPRRRRARGVQSTLAKASMLANFLPAGTLLAFEVALQAASVDGSCSAVSVATIRAPPRALRRLLLPLPLRLQLPDGKDRARRRGAQGGQVRLTFVDVVYAVMSVLVFAAVALADYRVSGCLLPGHRKEMDEVMESFPLMAGASVAWLPGVPQHPLRHRLLGCLKTSRDHRPDQSMAV